MILGFVFYNIDTSYIAQACYLVHILCIIFTPAPGDVLFDSMTNASAELFAAPSMLVAGSFDVETTSHALSPDDSLWEVF